MDNTFSVSEIFASRVFDMESLRERVSAEVFDDLQCSLNEGAELSLATAEKVAGAMKDWAIEHGATHFTHWFQPLTGVTAEKHVSFISVPDENYNVISEFSGKELVRGELDASSFPNGGLRATFEARGYTTWDCSSPAFLKEDSVGTILCIPTAFCTYSGDALDLKTPLLRSMEAINKASLRLLRALGDDVTRRVIPMTGAEQEYFLISKEKYLARKDLIYTGRTLFGAMPAKDQDVAAHYSGSISDRTGAFMKAVNEELWRYGVPAKLQHNEFAPAQHEICSVYMTANITADQNQLIMETLKKVADRQGLACLLHEKPFAGINGSGKHNNWSLITDSGVNLMDPGKNPEENVRFLLVLACIIAAVDKHASLLRLSAANPGNDYRLGGHEAPPAIISVYLGDALCRELDSILQSGFASNVGESERLKTGVPFLPVFKKDMTDRNRTSPFAFNGNRFEFRMVGSSDSVASSTTVLNSIAAQAFNEAASRIEAADDKLDAVYGIIREYVSDHKKVLFDGNGYSQEWAEEAERRGLPILPGMVDAIPALTLPETVDMFERLGVLSAAELSARAEIRYETFSNQMHIESLAMLNIANKQLIPAVIKYTEQLASSINAIKKTGTGSDTSHQENLLVQVSTLLAQAGHAAHALDEAIALTEANVNIATKARMYKDLVRTSMDALRTPLDQLEKLVDKSLWPIPSYGDMLFEI
ncbi:MAG: glutamine synthetase III [Lachnospiraceae bacterium]|nr:glutamine synthetase III [Candidatus Minthocola equi]